MERNENARAWLREAARAEHNLARQAVWALAAEAVVGAILILYPHVRGHLPAGNDDSAYAATRELLTTVLPLASLVAHLRWMWRAYTDVHAWEAERPRFTASAAVWGFFLPLLNLVWPVRATRDLLAFSEPDDLRPLTAKRRAEEKGYREFPDLDAKKLEAPWRVAPPWIERLISAPHLVTLWWAACLLGPFLKVMKWWVVEIQPFVPVCFCAAAVLSLSVIRSIDARRQERLRRQRWALRPKRWARVDTTEILQLLTTESTDSVPPLEAENEAESARVLSARR